MMENQDFLFFDHGYPDELLSPLFISADDSQSEGNYPVNQCPMPQSIKPGDVFMNSDLPVDPALHSGATGLLTPDTDAASLATLSPLCAQELESAGVNPRLRQSQRPLMSSSQVVDQRNQQPQQQQEQPQQQEQRKEVRQRPHLPHQEEESAPEQQKKRSARTTKKQNAVDDKEEQRLRKGAEAAMRHRLRKKDHEKRLTDAMQAAEQINTQRKVEYRAVKDEAVILIDRALDHAQLCADPELIPQVTTIRERIRAITAQKIRLQGGQE